MHRNAIITPCILAIGYIHKIFHSMYKSNENCSGTQLASHGRFQVVVAVRVLAGEGDCLVRLCVGILSRSAFNGRGGLFYDVD